MNQYEKDAIQQLRHYLGECVVLLKNNNDFPLSEPCEIGAYGRGVRHTLKGGTGSGEVNSRFYVTVEEALKKEGFHITSEKWLDEYDEVLKQARVDFIEEIKARAKEKHTMAVMEGMGAVMREPEHELKLNENDEVAIYVLSRICGEGNDRTFDKGDFLLNDSEVRDILYLNEHCKKFMLVLNVGGPVDLTPVNKVKNILVLSQLGVETGFALTDVLLGKQNPSGKLTMTWTSMEELPDIAFGNLDDTDYKEGIYVGYRYYDTLKKDVLYPFGYGLSYTDFEIKAHDLSLEKDIVNVDVEVKNKGKLAGKETVQLYVSCPQGKLDKVYQDLAAYGKTGLLEVKGKEKLNLSFSMRSLASYDEKTASYLLEKGSYVLRLGTSSRDSKVIGVIDLEEDVVLKKARNLLGDPGFKDQVFRCEYADDLSKVKHLSLDPKDLKEEIVDYDQEYQIDEAVKKLSDESLAYLNVGTFGKGLASVIGDASQSVAGAAGESSDKADLAGLKPLVMADGPAGLRISPLYYEDKKGIHSYGPSMPVTILEFMPKIMQKLMGGTPKLKKGTVLKEQYTTAIPIGTAIAQSFNEEFAQICGDIVGGEMEIFKIDLWLAPALNIHRHVLCGRNFEYFSEDPLISGNMASAITKGVQKHPGKGTTIKHYAVNNQETNRYTTNSNVSERALREIYLKGFEICVRDSQPLALMTSYNLLNGVHTNEHRGLCYEVLRKEYGFKGLIMTDWEVSAMPTGKNKYRMPDSDKVALAGGNLYMPGSGGDLKKILKALKDKSLDRAVLEESASRLYEMVRKIKA
ncbi:MAG: glycoside hydrolase family 3 C-terminal domain-containing protein [Erysipelotrichaceae bacterium]|nr:glycoside hydrolase family 3 C-terminal domain-containing protein [Erysipelotrichaceae bacterium]